jgi:anti-anti-sigma factor
MEHAEQHTDRAGATRTGGCDRPAPRGRGDRLPGSIAVVEEGGVRVLRLSGEIDSLVVAAYGNGSPSPAVIDASGVTFLDCRGLRLLVRVAHDARDRGARPVLRSPARAVRRVLDLAGAEGQFTVAP